MRLHRIAIVLLVLVATAADARADGEEDQAAAAAAFEEGSQAFAAGDFARAADAFDRAYAARPHHDALWNAARARHRAGDDVRAANGYARYLREAPADARDRDTATASLNALAKTLARIEVHRSPTLTSYTLDGVKLLSDFEEIWTTPGDHVLAAVSSESNAPLSKAFHVDPGTRVSVTIDEAPTSSNPRAEAEKENATKPPFPWSVVAIGGGLTAVLGGITIWSAINTVDQKDVFDKNRSQANLDEGRDRQTRTNILLGVTGGIAAITAITTALIVWSSSPSSTKKAAASVHVGLGSLSISGHL